MMTEHASDERVRIRPASPRRVSGHALALGPNNQAIGTVLDFVHNFEPDLLCCGVGMQN
jgi:hypothetical protein